MNCRIRNVALLLLVLVLATGLAYAQPGVKVSTVTNGSVTQTTYSPSSITTGPAPKAPRSGACPNSTSTLCYNYWDGTASTDYYNIVPYVTAPPNPQIAVGPDDIVTIVNRLIARYPNPNALGNSGPTYPYNNPPTSKTPLDAWLGTTNLATVCPTTPRSNSTCVIDNASIRYDQLQGRFVVLFTATDVPQHISNFVLVVSNYATFACSNSTHGNPPANTCPNTYDMFTPPVTPIVGGPKTGGPNTDWWMYLIPVNVVLPGTVTAGSKFCMTPKIGGDPASKPPVTGPANGPITTGCSDYYPTGARMGIDNDNIILTAPVLDMSQGVFPNNTAPFQTPAAGTTGGLPSGPYAGTRVVTVPKMVVYNTIALGSDPTSIIAGTGLVNLADNTSTATLTAITSQVPALTTCLGGTGTYPNCTAAPTNSAATTVTGGVNVNTNPIPPVYWEPNNVRGRSLASFNSQIGPYGTPVAGVITPIDYLVGTRITDDYGNSNPLGSGSGAPGSAVNTDTRFWIQPIVFYCSAGELFGGPGGDNFCGTTSSPAQAGGVFANESAALGVTSTGTIAPRTNVNSLAKWTDPALVGQGTITGGAGKANDGTAVGRLFVGDSRPQQVIAREGLLYVARTVRLSDDGVNNTGNNALGSSTVMYDVIQELGPQCPGTTHPSATFTGPYCTNPTGTAPALVGGTNPYTFGTTAGQTIVNPYIALETYWYNGQNVPDTTGNAGGYGFYAPMYEVPANVVSSNVADGVSSLPTSPINLFPWLEKLFVGETVSGPSNINGTFATHAPSLWDFRPGDDAFDTTLPFTDPYTGLAVNSITSPGAGTQPVIPFGFRGGASTDPNDGSLWMYGAFAKFRLSSVPGPGQWGTSVANYQLDFPATDSYGNDNAYFADVPPTNIYFTWVQIAKNLGLTQGFSFAGTCPTSAQINPPIVPPPTGTGSVPGTGTASGTPQTCFAFGPESIVTRSEMARWVVKSQMDEDQIRTYLLATGGAPGPLCAPQPTTGVSPNSPNACPTTSASANVLASSFTDDLNDPNINYIETLYRRGYTKGCGSTDDPRRKFCGSDPLTRAQMSVFLIRAKMNNVFPTSLSGLPLNWPNQYGDNFSLFLPTTPYFTDVNGSTDPLYGDYYIFIQKMRELRITNGTGGNTFTPGSNLTRKEIATFIVKAFFL